VGSEANQGLPRQGPFRELCYETGDHTCGRGSSVAVLHGRYETLSGTWGASGRQGIYGFGGTDQELLRRGRHRGDSFWFKPARRQDDGLGMTADEFENGFLRIAGRTKITADRRSTVFGRRYTGEKGVGRLAAHKLAREVRINSRKAGVAGRGTVELPPATMAIRASIDWDAIEALETLDQVAGSGAVALQQLPPPIRALASGTTLTMSPLRRSWS